ncbi:MAG TPA: FtsX-like permease family protein [Fimbriimonadaceae bacterium]|nr:FtsX-like permease family protein [Fimbriimonadaceae bacterium]
MVEPIEATKGRTKALPKARPLVASTYLVRNARKTTPLVAVIVLAVLLVAGIVSIMNSIPLSIRTIYSYSKIMLGVTPRGDADMTPRIQARILADSPVPIDRLIVCRASGAQVRSIVGKWPFVVIALEQEDMRYYLRRMEATRIEGRTPGPGKAEALISAPVAKNLGLGIGDELIGPEKNEAYSPQSVKIVGIADSRHWLMLAPIEYHKVHHFPPIDLLVVFARNAADQERLDTWATKAFRGERAQVFAWSELEKTTNEMFSTLYKILNVVIALLVLVITLMMGMLMNIYQSQRLQEYGLLQALGYTKKRLLRRSLAESVIVVLGGWVVGLLAAHLLLRLVKLILMDPSAFSLDTLDPVAFLYTVPIPIAILGAAFLTVWIRFRDFDPVGVVERRLI